MQIEHLVRIVCPLTVDLAWKGEISFLMSESLREPSVGERNVSSAELSPGEEVFKRHCASGHHIHTAVSNATSAVLMKSSRVVDGETYFFLPPCHMSQIEGGIPDTDVFLCVVVWSGVVFSFPSLILYVLYASPCYTLQPCLTKLP